MSNELVTVWIETCDGGLILADVIIELACQDGTVTTRLPGGRELSLAGPCCPPGFHRELLAQLALSRLLHGSSQTIVITAQADAAKTG